MSWATQFPIGRIHFTARYIISAYSVQTAFENGAVYVYLQVEYVMSYACAGSMLQICALPRDSDVTRTLGCQFSMAIYISRPAVYDCCCYPSVLSHQSTLRAASRPLLPMRVPAENIIQQY